MSNFDSKLSTKTLGLALNQIEMLLDDPSPETLYNAATQLQRLRRAYKLLCSQLPNNQETESVGESK